MLAQQVQRAKCFASARQRTAVVFSATCAPRSALSVPHQAFKASLAPSTRHSPRPSSAVLLSRTRKQVVVQANWGAPVEFKPAKVVSNKLAAPGLHQVIVDVGQEVAAGYTKPGQYIQAKVAADGKPGFFAIASAPDANNQGLLELLIKSQPGATAEAICQLAAGAQLQVSPVQGKGFPVDRIPAADFPTVLMFATGSGISPIKAVIESDVLDMAKRAEVRLYYGTKDEESTAYSELVPKWTAAGVRVVQVFSGNDKQYVQGVFADEVAHLRSPQQVGVLLCGHKDMCTKVTELCKAQGVEQVLLNF